MEIPFISKQGSHEEILRTMDYKNDGGKGMSSDAVVIVQKREAVASMRSTGKSHE